MAFKSQSLNFYQTYSNAIFSIVFASLLYIVISTPISYLSDRTRREKLLRKDGLLKLNADLAFWITCTKCMQNINGLIICRITPQRTALPIVNKYPGPNRSDISDLRQCSTFEVQKSSYLSRTSLTYTVNLALLRNNFDTVEQITEMGEHFVAAVGLPSDTVKTNAPPRKCLPPDRENFFSMGIVESDGVVEYLGASFNATGSTGKTWKPYQIHLGGVL